MGKALILYTKIFLERERPHISFITVYYNCSIIITVNLLLCLINKLYHKYISIGKNTLDQWNRLDNLEIKPHMYPKFNKGTKTTLWGKSSLSTNNTGKAGYSYGKA